jgi:hypothetical protein
MTLVLFVLGSASAETIWLDQVLKPWNVAGAAVPTAPPAQLVQQICTTRERAAANAEEKLISGARWRLEEYWPTVRRGNLAVVLALSDYDGMCRPYGYNAFVFADGKYAGTLSPVKMNSRFDGMLNRIPDLPADGVVRAIYTRYSPKDPLCCPSLPTTVVTYGLLNGTIAPMKLETVPANALPPVPPAAQGQPSHLPRTGDGLNPGLALVLGIVILRAGMVLRRVRSR